MAKKNIDINEVILPKLKEALSRYDSSKYFEYETIPDHGIRVVSETFTQGQLKAMFKVINRYHWMAFVEATVTEPNKIKFFCYGS